MRSRTGKTGLWLQRESELLVFRDANKLGIHTLTHYIRKMYQIFVPDLSRECLDQVKHACAASMSVQSPNRPNYGNATKTSGEPGGGGVLLAVGHDLSVPADGVPGLKKLPACNLHR